MITTAIVLFFSLFHSIFGMGLLVFGTPTMLLLGFDFDYTLVSLLPPSLIISSLQLYKDYKNIDRRMAMNFAIFCLPFVVLCLSFSLYTQVKFKLEYGVALLLLVSLLLRTVSFVEEWMRQLISSYQKPFFVIMGAIHGFTNMGGALLSVFARSQYTTKEKVLNCVALCYVSLGVLQTGVLVIFKPHLFRSEVALLCLGAGAIYLTLGRFLFASTSEFYYKKLFSIFMFIYAVLLILKGLGLMPHK